MSIHSILSPSGAPRWSRCIGSLAMSKGLPNPATRDSALGTAKHDISARCLNSRIYEQRDAKFYLGSKIKVDKFEFTVDQEFADHVMAYVNAIRREPGEMYVELTLDTSTTVGVANQSGTADVAMLNYERKQLSIHDAKFGYSPVEVLDNEQLLIYAAAAWNHFSLLANWDSVRIVIHQPPRNHYDECCYTADGLRAFISSITPKAQQAKHLYDCGTPEQIRAALTPGEKQCHFCLARGTCRARAEQALTLFPVNDASKPGQPLLMDEAEIAQKLKMIDGVEAWCSDLRAEASRRALAGKQLPGFKVVRQKMGPRYWVDKEAVEYPLVHLMGEEEAYEPRKIISPTAAEKLLPKDNYQELSVYVGQKEGALTLVPEADKRDAVPLTQLQFEPTTESLL